jgi:hypothetical protein
MLEIEMPEIDMGEFSSIDAAREAIMKRHPKTAQYADPWWGDKQSESGNLSTRGYVIGFKDVRTSAQWRLDYDEIKKLHINWTQEVRGSETLKECYRISSIRPRDELFDYYVGWTRPRSDDIPAEIKDRLDKVGGTKTWNGRYWSA